jgi:anti-anti-sigma factor
MATTQVAAASTGGRSERAGHGSEVPEVPVVVLDQAMLVSGFVRLRSGVAALLQAGARTLVVDVSELDRLSSSTVSALLWAQRRCHSSGGSILLRGVNRRTYKTLRRTGLWQVLQIESSLGDTGPSGTVR